MSLLGGLGKVAAGVVCIACAPIAVGAAISTTAAIGAAAVVGGIATDAMVIGAGLTAATVTQKSVFTIGAGMAARGAKETLED